MEGVNEFRSGAGCMNRGRGKRVINELAMQGSSLNVGRSTSAGRRREDAEEWGRRKEDKRWVGRPRRLAAAVWMCVVSI